MLENLKKLKQNSLLIFFQGTLRDLPTPSFIRYLWNWGFILGVVLIIQIITGLILASHYSSDIFNSFASVIHILRDVNSGYILRFAHINGASIFFIFVYFHIFRNIIFNRYKNSHTWGTGIVILLALMGTAFLGYVLPWGQISYWGATVITNLASAIPIVGVNIVQWLWGGFSIRQATLRRFYILHFLLPFIITALVIIHIFFLHEKGSNNPLGISLNIDKVPFIKYFVIKDFLAALITTLIFFFFIFIIPLVLNDPENFIPANPLSTPIHIIPEWYFLFAYAILRSIPNKLGGVLALVISIIVFYFHITFKKSFKSHKFKPFSKIISFFFIFLFLLLTWLGSCAVEYPFEDISKIVSLIYFIIVFFL